MPEPTNQNEEHVNQQKRRYRVGRIRRNKYHKQVRVTGFVNISLAGQQSSICRTCSLEKQTCNCNTKSRVSERSWRELLSEDKRYIDPEDLGGENLVYWFMTKGDDEPRRMYQAEVVDSLCHRAVLQQLQSNSCEVVSEKICLIDDRSSDGSTSVSIGDYGLLSVREMYLKMMEKRFHAPSPDGTTVEPNVDRRLIFVTNPSSHAIATLMVTTPGNYVDALIDFLYLYVAFKSHIGVHVRNRGFATFSYSFHLPIFSWTCTEQAPCDARSKKNNLPLRETHNMSFLEGRSQTSVNVNCLSETQTSVLIAGIDRQVWTGYCFTDTYCQPEVWRRSVDEYHKSSSQMDPFTDGRCESGLPILDPGEYFLISLECQLKVFKDEWMKTAQMFKNQVEVFTDAFQFDSMEPNFTARRESQVPLDWLQKTRRILGKLTESLETTIDCWDNFTSENLFPTPHGQQSLSTIQQIFVDIKNCLKQLQNIHKKCDEFEKTLNLHNINATHRVSRLQAQVAESTQALSYFILHILSPATLAAAILSMQEKAIPGILGPNKLSFFVLTPVLVVLLFAVSRMVYCWDKIQMFMAKRIMAYLLRRDQIDIEQDIEAV